MKNTNDKYFLSHLGPDLITFYYLSLNEGLFQTNRFAHFSQSFNQTVAGKAIRNRSMFGKMEINIVRMDVELTTCVDTQRRRE